MRDGARPVSTTGCYLLSVIAQGIGGFQAGGFAGRIPSGKADDERQDQPSQQELIRKQPTLDSTKPGGIKSIQRQIHANQQGRDGGDRQQHQALPITKPKMEARVEPIAIRKPSSARRRLT